MTYLICSNIIIFIGLIFACLEINSLKLKNHSLNLKNIETNLKTEELKKQLEKESSFREELLKWKGNE